MPNRLANETSPYLLQHKDNPVDWYAWGDDAFEQARKADKPILLSVGYSACHWCHVMAHESFEDPRIAALMNDAFVNIKVDREERPDVDNIYMQAVQSLTGRGGWPMTVFLTPEGVPFYGGTYYPPEDRQGMPGFPRLLTAVADAYKNKRQQIEIAGHDLLQRIGAPSRLQSSDSALTESILNQAAAAILEAHDDEFGGFGRAPKFPQPMTLDFLMRYYHSTKQPAVIEALHKTLRAMAQGGMYDQVGGGFHRYSTDTVWLVPHFEKMLYDNALLARVYLDAFKLMGEPFYRRIAQQTLDYVLREMTDPSGGFYSTQDADSEGEEGKFFLWTPAEIEEVLGPDDAALAGAFYGVTDAGNFEGSNILHVRQAPEAFLAAQSAGGQDRAITKEYKVPSDTEAFEAFLEDARARLYQARERRVHPARDEKVLTAWNGLMLRAFAEAALAFDSSAYRDAATRNADFLLGQMRRGTRLLRTWKHVLSNVEGHVLSNVEGQGEARLNAYLDDYACLIDGLIAVHAATFEPRYLRSAVELADEMIALFWDEKVQGFFDTGSDHESLIVRPRDFFDNATPSGASVAIDVLLRLAAITGNEDYENRATICLRTLTPFVEDAATAFGRLLASLEFYLARSQELAIIVPVADSPSPSTGRGQGGGVEAPSSEPRALLEPVRLLYAPNLLLVGSAQGEGADATPLLQERPTLNGLPTAYVCERYVCQAPTTDPAQLLLQLQSLMP
jgi:uncharacterized protein YyaL (SSP411 family)